MPIKESRHTFTKGMIKDTDKSVVDPNTYEDAQNFRYLADELGNSGVLYVPDASSVLDSDFESNERIIGHCVIRDYLVLFTYIDEDEGARRIRRYTLSDKSLTDSTLLWVGSTGTQLAFSQDEVLSIVGRYESEDVIKVYWASKQYPIRVANIADYITDDGLAATPSNSLDVNRFDLVTNFNVVPSAGDLISINSIISGGLQTGRVQYAISLYKENNQETNISYLTTSPINIFNDNLEVTPSAKIKGDYETIQTNKSIKLTINIDSSDVEYFDKYRLYRVYYSEYGQLPEITIVNDFNIAGTENSCVDYGGVGLGTYSSEEFSLLTNIQYEAYEINEKDNRLIAANLVEQTFDVDWDARAYRFTSSAGTQLANIYTDYTGSSLEASIDGTSPDYTIVDEDFNCVNLFNSVENDGNTSYQYMYQSDGATIGGEGPNLKYTFIDEDDIRMDTIAYTPTSWTYDSDTFIYSSGPSDFSNPIVVHDYTGYQRDDVYRFGIVWINNKGQKSTVKWVGDIRFPISIVTGDSNDLITSFQPEIHAQSLGIQIKIKTIGEGGVGIPSEAVAWELVRVPRNEADKSVIRAGVVIDTYDDGSNYTYKAQVFDFANNLSTSNTQVINFITPENTYNNSSTIEAGDYLDIVAASDYNYTHNNANGLRTDKFYRYTAFTDYTNKRYDIDQAEFVSPSYDDTINNDYTFTGAVNSIYRGWCFDGSINRTSHGRCDVLQLNTSLNNATLYQATPGIGYGYVKRDNEARYGGYEYNNRLNNTYVSCGSPSSSTSTVNLWGGDTYICYFNYAHSMYADDQTTRADTRILLTPVESTINLTLAHGDLPSSNPDRFLSVSSTQYLLKEESGVHSYNSGAEVYTQDRDLYLYNTVYSQEQNIKFDITYSEENSQSEFDTRVAYSDLKLDNSTVDAWTIFRPNNSHDVTGTYGSINKLAKYNNTLYFYQDKAFGILPVNQRSLIQDNNAGILLLGTGDILDRHDYINIFYGAQAKESVDVVNSGIYSIDANKRSVIKFSSNGIENLGNTKGLRSYFLNIEPETVPIISGNDNNNEVYIYYKDKILTYNTLSNTFISFYNYEPTYMGNTNLFHFYQLSPITDESVYGLYLEDSKRARWNGVDYEDSYITLIDNAEFLKTKAYDNLKFYTNHTNGDTDYYNTTFSIAEFSNDYQATDEVSLTVGDNVERDEREFKMVIPRNIVSTNETTAVDITDSANYSILRTFRERMRDKYIKTTLIFENDSTKSDARFSVAYLIFNYRTSSR